MEKPDWYASTHDERRTYIQGLLLDGEFLSTREIAAMFSPPISKNTIIGWNHRWGNITFPLKTHRPGGSTRRYTKRRLTTSRLPPTKREKHVWTPKVWRKSLPDNIVTPPSTTLMKLMDRRIGRECSYIPEDGAMHENVMVCGLPVHDKEFCAGHYRLCYREPLQLTSPSSRR